MPGIMYTPPQQQSDDDGQMEIIDADSILEEIDIEQQPEAEQVLNGINDMDLENYDADGDKLPDTSEAADGASDLEKDDAEMVFRKHTGSVFCVNLDPLTASLAVTGGEDDKAFVWKVHDGEVLFECHGHKDSVTAAMFSHDAAFVATGDMSGIIKVWSVANKEEVWNFEVADLEWLQWHHSANVLLAGTVDGDMWMWRVPAGECKTMQGTGQSCSVGAIMPDGKRACAGYEDGTVKVWNLRTTSVLHTFSGQQGHSEPITCLTCHHDNTLALTGATDVTARLLNTMTGKSLAVFDCSTATARTDQENSVEAVGFSPVQSLAATGTLVGALSIWDVPTQKMRHQCMHDAGIVRLRWDWSAPVIYTCALDGTCQLWDARSGRREACWVGHSEEVLDIDLTRDSSMLVTACGDKTSRVFSLHTPDR